MKREECFGSAKCDFCKKALRSFKSTKDWKGRKYHKCCYGVAMLMESFKHHGELFG